MTFPEIIQSINDNGFTLIFKSGKSGIKCELSKTVGSDIIAQRFIVTKHQFRFINDSIENMINNLLKEEKRITLQS